MTWCELGDCDGNDGTEPKVARFGEQILFLVIGRHDSRESETQYSQG